MSAGQSENMVVMVPVDQIERFMSSITQLATRKGVPNSQGECAIDDLVSNHYGIQSQSEHQGPQVRTGFPPKGLGPQSHLHNNCHAIGSAHPWQESPTQTDVFARQRAIDLSTDRHQYFQAPHGMSQLNPQDRRMGQPKQKGALPGLQPHHPLDKDYLGSHQAARQLIALLDEEYPILEEYSQNEHTRRCDAQGVAGQQAPQMSGSRGTHMDYRRRAEHGGGDYRTGDRDHLHPSFNAALPTQGQAPEAYAPESYHLSAAPAGTGSTFNNLFNGFNCAVSWGSATEGRSQDGCGLSSEASSNSDTHPFSAHDLVSGGHHEPPESVGPHRDLSTPQEASQVSAQPNGTERGTTMLGVNLLRTLQLAKTQSAILEVLSKVPVDQLGHATVCVSMSCLAKVRGKCSLSERTPMIGQLLKRAMEVLPHFKHQHVCNLLHSMAKLNIRDLACVELLKQQLMQPEVYHHLNAQDVSNALWSLATMKISMVTMVQPLVARAKVPTVLQQCTSQHLANILWAMAKLGFTDTDFFHVLAARALSQEVLLTFSAQGVANVIWSCAKLGFKHHKLMAALAQVGTQPMLLHNYLSQHMANIVWGWARLRMPDLDFVHALLARVQEPKILRSFNHLELANFTWACAEMGIKDRGLYLALAGQTMQPSIISQYSSLDLAFTSWAFATASIRHEPLLAALTQRAMCPEVAATFNAQAVSKMIWACGRLGLKHTPLLGMLAGRALAPSVLTKLRPWQISNISWGMAALGYFHGPLMHSLGEQIAQPAMLSACQSTDVANTMWAFASLGVLTAELMDKLQQRALDPVVLAKFTRQDVCALTVTYAKLGIDNCKLLNAVRHYTSGNPISSPPCMANDGHYGNTDWNPEW